ncbi:MAG: alanine dehydrogenase [Candidatus Promineifilaceae bacterium]|nr:alanine dehydrogenase [Candidatus Promineifilaceae bacterium]
MIFTVPREIRESEMRVGLTPAGVQALVNAGHTMYVEKEAGLSAGFQDVQYRHAGAEIVYSPAEAYQRGDVVVKVARPTAGEHSLFRPGQTILSYLHLPVSSPDLLEALTAHQITAIAYEMIEEEDGHYPLLVPMSEIAGRLAPIIAGRHLMTINGGRGTLLSGIPGAPPAAVVILGGGVLGSNAARAFISLGAQVTVLDKKLARLRKLEEQFGGRVATLLATDYNVRRVAAFADVVVGCVQVPGHRAPILLSREDVQAMRMGSVIVDFSIDQGGCVATSRPTTLFNPTYIEAGVIHYCVPNMTSGVARTASYALTNSALPYLLELGAEGTESLLSGRSALARGVNLYRGEIVHPELNGLRPQRIVATPTGGKR